MSALTVPALLALAQVCSPHIAPGTILSVAWAESGFRPAIVHRNKNLTSDFGLTQINESNLYRLGLTRTTALDPCRSLEAAQHVLMENFHPQNNTPEEQQRALRQSLAAYNAGPRGGPNEVYIRKVQAAAQRVIPEIRIAGIPAPADAPAPASRVAAPPPPTPDVTARPASAGRELVFTRGNQ